MQVPSPTVSQEYIYSTWKYISEWSFSLIKNFYLSIKEISILNKLFLIKLSADIFPNFSAGNSVSTDFEMYTIFWQMSFYSKFSCLKKANTTLSIFYTFDKS